MEVLTLNGKKYVKASKAARDLGYASDYVGQLCRSGAVDAHLVGRTWYVNPDTVGAHRIEKKRNARVKAREHAKRSIEQARSLKVTEEVKTSKKIAIHYEGDQSELIPAVRRIVIESELHPTDSPVEDSDGSYAVENKDQKIIMSGPIEVHDAEAEEQFTDVTVLTPKINRKGTRMAATPVRTVIPQEVDTDVAHVEPKKETFAERISAYTPETAVEPILTETAAPQEEAKGSFGYFIVPFSVLVMLLSVASIFFATKFTFEEGRLTTSFHIETRSVIDFVN